jgi:hypothetical protein
MDIVQNAMAIEMSSSARKYEWVLYIDEGIVKHIHDLYAVVSFKPSFVDGVATSL